jgi:hypothetical protein
MALRKNFSATDRWPSQEETAAPVFSCANISSKHDLKTIAIGYFLSHYSIVDDQ